MKKRVICIMLILVMVIGSSQAAYATEALVEDEYATEELAEEVATEEPATEEPAEKDYPQEVKDAGVTYEQYQAILAMPKFPESELRIEFSNARATSAQQAVVNMALSFRGVPYVWGGTTPSGFDCSGLVQYVYLHAVGIVLPRVTYHQEYEGDEVSLNELQLGDLLFFGARYNTHHVSIYIGNNQYVHAPEQGEVVKITTIGSGPATTPSFARRILPSEPPPPPVPISPFIGHLDAVTTTSIGGWAKNRNNEAESVTVHIYINEVGRQTVANLNRPDVGAHAFSVPISWKTYKPGNYTIKAYAIGEQNLQLPNPITYTVRPIEGYVDAVAGSGIRGWTWKPDAPNEAIEAHIYIYNQAGDIVDSRPITAGTYRPDLKDKGYGNGKHGFTYVPNWGSLPKEKLRVTVTAVDGSTVNQNLYDGTYDNQRENVEKFVRHLYTEGLGRQPDAEGLKNHTNNLLKGGTAAQTIEAFFLGKEYTSKKTTDTQFVEAAYKAILGRSVDESGKKNMLNALKYGVSRKYVLFQIIHSAEFTNQCKSLNITRGNIVLTEQRDKNIKVTGYVYYLYVNALGRKPDTGGLNTHTGSLNSGGTAASVIKAFLTSKEYTEKKRSNADFVEDLYKTILLRASDSGGKQHWVSKLNSGVSRLEVIKGFIGSVEFANICARYGIPVGSL